MDHKAVASAWTEAGWELHYRSADFTSFNFFKTFTGNMPKPYDVTIHAALRQQADGKWLCEFIHLPGTQMMVRLCTGSFSYPNRNLDKFLERIRGYAVAMS